jgi:hypothetical protein
MSESRVPEIPLPRPFLRVVSEEKVTKDDVERVRKGLQQRVDTLEGELRRERELVKKLEKSGAVLQEILAAPDFRALTTKAREASAGVEVAAPAAGARADEPPVEYVEVTEIELTDAEVNMQDSKPPAKKSE